MDEAFPVRTLKERQRRQREELILRSTEEVLVEKGYAEMSMDEIAARVGIAKGTLYLHFAKKEDLVLALLEYEIGLLHEILAQAQAQPGSVRGKLEFLVQTLYQQFVEPQNKLLYAFFSAADIRRLLKEKHELLLGDIWRKLAHLLAEGQERGEFDPTIPVEVMLDAFINVAFARLRSLHMRQRNISAEEATTILLRIFFRGISAQDSEA